jgi:hypothetical protein
MQTRLRDLGSGIGRDAGGLPDGARALAPLLSQRRSNGWPSRGCSFTDGLACMLA